MPVPDFDAAVRSLYRAATGATPWDGALASLRDGLGATSLHLVQAPAPAGAPDAPACWVQGPGTGLPGPITRLRLRPQVDAAVTVQISWSDEQPPDAATQAWLDRLAPHLLAALRTAERLRQWPARSQLGELLLDTLAQPAWLLRADGGIVWANAAARRTSTADRWWQAGGPRLLLRDAADQQALDTACQQALAAPRARPVLVPLPGTGGCGARSTVTGPAPLQARWLLRRLAARAGDPVLLAILFDPQASGADPAALSAPLLAGAFGFTPAESRVAVCLAQGCTVREIASRLGVAASTVRSQLDAVTAKLGVVRKLDAVRLLVQGGWMWRAWPGEGMQDA